VARLPLGPMVNFAPRGPNEREPPDLLRFRVTPGAILIRLQKRKLILTDTYAMLSGPHVHSLLENKPRLASAFAGHHLQTNIHTFLQLWHV